MYDVMRINYITIINDMKKEEELKLVTDYEKKIFSQKFVLASQSLQPAAKIIRITCSISSVFSDVFP